MLLLASQMLTLPVVTLVYSLEALISTMQGFQETLSQSLVMVADDVAQTLSDAPGSRHVQASAIHVVRNDAISHDGVLNTVQPAQKEEVIMSAQDLSNDLVKLVEYSIVSIERGDERELPEGSGKVVFSENMTSSSFAAWRIAEYTAGSPPRSISADATKYLRVYYRVLDTWPRQSLRYEERQLDILERIEEKMPSSQYRAS